MRGPKSPAGSRFSTPGMQALTCGRCSSEQMKGLEALVPVGNLTARGLVRRTFPNPFLSEMAQIQDC